MISNGVCTVLQGSEGDTATHQQQDTEENKVFCFQAEKSFEGLHALLLEQHSGIMSFTAWRFKMLKWAVNKARLAYLKAMSPCCYGLGHLVILIR